MRQVTKIFIACLAISVILYSYQRKPMFLTSAPWGLRCSSFHNSIKPELSCLHSARLRVGKCQTHGQP